MFLLLIPVSILPLDIQLNLLRLGMAGLQKPGPQSSTTKLTSVSEYISLESQGSGFNNKMGTTIWGETLTLALNWWLFLRFFVDFPSQPYKARSVDLHQPREELWIFWKPLQGFDKLVLLAI